ncbi:hypothetical protein N7522_010558 [Penicillium canescens]|uniref:Uncharacterized protein n=1 Tax=Penicillium canescens TaxID=5083 RepID=A0AAD6NDB8_PENCN|nr:hypothetical protein N7522_010558 [Penicillium canescens]KAJ6051522.1 hypothetical protein N7460_002056 [Penicillium canescens]
MECLSSISLRSLLPNCMQAFWEPKTEQKIEEDLEQTLPNAANLYSLTEPAIYEPENTKSASSLPLPVCNPKQTEKGEASQISLIRDCYNSIQSDGKTDSNIIVLPYIPPNFRLVNGRIIDGERDTPIS